MTRGKVILLGFLFIVCFVGGSQLTRIHSLTDLLPSKLPIPGADKKSTLEEKGVMNVLLLGIDARKGETNARSDTMILAVVDTKKNKIALVSIPRDTRVRDDNGYKKINAYNAEGGPELATQKVEELMGISIDYYVLTNFSGFKDIVDTLGGVTIDVDKRMYKPSEDINLRPGLQRLNGRQALAYCRFRSDALGDIGRTERQQKFLIALADEVMQTSTITKLPRLIPEVRSCVQTNLPVSGMYELAKVARNFKTEDIKTQTLPGSFYNDPRTGASYWLVDKTKIPGLIDRLLAGEQENVIEEKTNNSQSSSGKKQSSRDDYSGNRQRLAAYRPLIGKGIT